MNSNLPESSQILSFSKHSEVSPTHSFKKEGLFTKSLILTYGDECDAIIQGIIFSSKLKDIDLDETNILPIRTSEFNITLERNLEISFSTPQMKESLDDILNNYRKLRKSFTKREIIKYCFPIVGILLDLSKKGISHGNLKPSNVLRNNNGKTYLSDMRIRKSPSSIIYKGDAWSLGMLMLKFCLIESYPVLSDLKFQRANKINEENFQDIQCKYGEIFKELITKLLAAESDNIVIFEEALTLLKQVYNEEKEESKGDDSEGNKENFCNLTTLLEKGLDEMSKPLRRSTCEEDQDLESSQNKLRGLSMLQSYRINLTMITVKKGQRTKDKFDFNMPNTIASSNISKRNLIDFLKVLSMTVQR